jgi:hypothetical protein
MISRDSIEALLACAPHVTHKLVELISESCVHSPHKMERRGCSASRTMRISYSQRSCGRNSHHRNLSAENEWIFRPAMEALRDGGKLEGLLAQFPLWLAKTSTYQAQLVSPTRHRLKQRMPSAL